MERDDEIRAIAYQLWEEEGRPEGRDAEHWFKAEEIWQARQAQTGQSAQRGQRRTRASSRRKQAG